MKHVLSDALRKALLASCCLAPVALPVWAQQAPAPQERVRFDVPAQNLGAALTALAQQSGKEIVIAADSVRGRFARELHGDYTLDEALDALLQGMGLRHRLSGNGTIVVEREMEEVRAESFSGNAKDLPTVVVRKPFTDANVDIVRTENDVQPYYIFGGEEIVQSNVANVEEFLKQRLTMNTVAGTYSQSSILAGSLGGSVSQVNLRGLGLDQTLILVNGRRVAGSGSGNSAPQFDINAIAPSMIERIEVLPTSASAIYGGNAVGGVLNVILKRDFTGGDVQARYDTPLDANVPVASLSAGYGWAFEDGRTHVTLSASYRNGKSLLYEDRPELVQRGFSRILERSPELLYSASSPYLYGTTPNISSTDGAPLVFKDGTALTTSLTYVPRGTSAQTSAAELRTGLLGNDGRQNTDPPRLPANGYLNSLLSEFSNSVEAVAVSGAVRRRMTDRLELVGEVFYNSNRATGKDSLSQFLFLPSDALSNPFQQDIFVTAPFPQRAHSRFRQESMRMVGGFVMDLSHDWRAQGDYTWNRSEGRSEYGPLFDAGSAGALSSAALLDGTLNPLIDTLQHPLDLSPYMTSSSMLRYGSASTLSDIGLRASGPIGSLPAGEPRLTIGLGRREEKQPWGYADQSGYGFLNYLPQSQRVSSVYAEALIPVVSQANRLPGLQLLELQLASRLEDFSVRSSTASHITFPPDYLPDPDREIVQQKIDYSSTNTTVGLRYKPAQSLTLRASYATAFLPPAFSYLLPNAPDPTGIQIRDPRRGNELVEVPYVRGGNPDLKPMDSKSWNIGLVFEPASWSGARFGLEWFQIERENLIFQPTTEQILAKEDQFPGRVTRADPVPGDPFGVGRVTFIDYSVVNASHVAMKGIDFSAGYVKDVGSAGVFSVHVLGTAISSFTQQIALTSPSEDIAGRVAEDGPLKLRMNGTLGWERGPWSLSWTVFHYGSYEQFDDPLYIRAQGGTRVPHQTYHDFQVGYRFAPGGEGDGLLSDFSIALGIRNVFNTLPPFDAYQAAVQYYSPFGDYRMRSVQLSVRKRF